MFILLLAFYTIYNTRFYWTFFDVQHFWVATQRCQHLTPEVLSNTITKIVLPVDASEVLNTSKKFRFDPHIIGGLQSLNALVRLGTESFKIKIKAYYERV